MSFSGLTIRRKYEGTHQQLLTNVFDPILQQTSKSILYVDGRRPDRLAGILELIKGMIRNTKGAPIRVLVELTHLDKHVSKLSTNPGERSDQSAFVAGGSSPASQTTATLCQVKLISTEPGDIKGPARATLTGLFEDDRGRQMLCEVDSLEDPSNVSMRVAVKWSWADHASSIREHASSVEACWASALPARDLESAFAHLGDRSRTSGPSIPDPRPYQREAIQKWLGQGARGLLRMCTGSGKTKTAIVAINELGLWCRSREQKLGTVVICVPTKILVEQWDKEIRAAYKDSPPLLAFDSVDTYISRLQTYLNGGQREGLRFVVTTYDSFCGRAFQYQLNQTTKSASKALLIADEVHNAAAPGTRKALIDSNACFPFKLGLSATPEIEGDEAGTHWLMEYFGGLAYRYDLERALAEKVLCNYEYYPHPCFLSKEQSQQYLRILERLSDSSGEGSLQLYSERRAIFQKSTAYLKVITDLVTSWSKQANLPSHILVFCPPGSPARLPESEADTELTLESHLSMVKSILSEANMIVGTIIGQTLPDQRRAIIRMFDEGRYNVLMGMLCLDEGLDIPSIRTAVMLYSFDRERQFVQRRGRILRKADGKDKAVIHDTLLLPHNSELSPGRAEDLLRREMRRYDTFAKTAINSREARAALDKAIKGAMNNEST